MCSQQVLFFFKMFCWSFLWVGVTGTLKLGLLYTTATNCEEILTNNNSLKVEITNWNYGRLGNTLISTKSALIYSLINKCNLQVPSYFVGLGNYSSPKRSFCFNHSIQTTHHLEKHRTYHVSGEKACTLAESSRYWYFHYNHTAAAHFDPIIHHELKEYMGFNETHSFGKRCSQEETCLGVHVRSGDVFGGSFNKSSGHWMPAKVNVFYEQPPLAYYLHVIKGFRDRHKNNNHVVKVACESLDNPVCQMFQVLSATEEFLEMEVSLSLLSTLQCITCCEEVVLSNSTMSQALILSPRLKHVHRYGQGQCSGTFSFDESFYLADGYTFDEWHNTELQRYNLLRPYRIRNNTCHHQKR